MIVKMLCTFEFNPETNKYTPLGDPEIVQSKPKSIINSSEPQLILEDNKYQLTFSAVELLNLKVGDKVDIKYEGGYPVIGSSTVWKCSSGNKLTKSSTVSYRGKANELLSRYGTVFTFTPWEGHTGLFILNGDKQVDVVEDSNVSVPVTSELEDDIKEDIKENFDLDDLSLDDVNDTELSNFKFKF